MLSSQHTGAIKDICAENVGSIAGGGHGILHGSGDGDLGAGTESCLDLKISPHAHR